MIRQRAGWCDLLLIDHHEGSILGNQEPFGGGARDRDVTRRSKCLIFGCAGFAMLGCWHQRFSDAAGAQHSQLQKMRRDWQCPVSVFRHGSAVCPSADIRAAQRIAVPQIEEWQAAIHRRRRRADRAPTKFRRLIPTSPSSATGSVNRGPDGPEARLPISPWKRTSPETVGMSQEWPLPDMAAADSRGGPIKASPRTKRKRHSSVKRCFP